MKDALTGKTRVKIKNLKEIEMHTCEDLEDANHSYVLEFLRTVKGKDELIST